MNTGEASVTCGLINAVLFCVDMRCCSAMKASLDEVNRLASSIQCINQVQQLHYSTSVFFLYFLLEWMTGSD